MVQFLYHIQFPAKYTKYAKMKSNCILYRLYRLLSLLYCCQTISHLFNQIEYSYRRSLLFYGYSAIKRWPLKKSSTVSEVLLSLRAKRTSKL